MNLKLITLVILTHTFLFSTFINCVDPTDTYKQCLRGKYGSKSCGAEQCKPITTELRDCISNTSSLKNAVKDTACLSKIKKILGITTGYKYIDTLNCLGYSKEDVNVLLQLGR